MSRRLNRSQATNLNASSQSQLSQSSRRGNQSLSPSSQDQENYAQHTVATVKYILNHMATNLPLKRADLVKDCCNGNTRIFTAILSTVQMHLQSVYGIIFHEVSSVKGGNKQYICFADEPAVSLVKLKKCDRKNQSLKLLILSYMFVKGTSIGEGVLLNFLEQLGIDIDVEHEHFGDVKQCLETFRKQLYIKREKKVSEASNEEQIIIEWGERALMEFDKKTMLVEVAEMFRKPTLFFKKQHMELIVEAENMEVDA